MGGKENELRITIIKRMKLQKRVEKLKNFLKLRNVCFDMEKS